MTSTSTSIKSLKIAEIRSLQLSILYRGPLSSCNYGCEYCPFAKKVETPEEHKADGEALERFVTWIAQRNTDDEISVFFTPWGEALPHKRYQDAIQRLSHMPQIKKVAIQTNLSAKLTFVERCNKGKVALWATYHPGETSRPAFLQQCQILSTSQVNYSVGVVGLKEHFDEIVALRQDLPADVYLWVNAYKRESGYYSADDLRLLLSIDPLFSFNNKYHPSLGEDCRCGSTVISVDGAGTMQRCHFIKESIGNIYDTNFADALKRTPCTAISCGCHIGYVHMDSLKLYEVFGDGVLERIPAK